VSVQLYRPSKTQLMLVGTNHKHAPIELRERLSCQTDQLPPRLRALVEGHVGIEEAVVLSTCNRTEVYIATASDSRSHESAERSSSPSFSLNSVQDYVIQTMAEWARISYSSLKEHVYCLTDENAVRHLFDVASGLDSLVIGEQQIKGQVHDAAKTAAKSHTAGRLLTELFQHACHVAEYVEERCDLDFGDVSASSASISLLAKASADTPIRSMLLVGAGKMIKLAASSLSSLNLSEIWVANRTAKRAEELAERVGGSVLPFNKVQEALERADAVLTCTSSQDYVIKYDDLESAVRRRDGRPIVIVDASVPRNVDPTAAKIPGVILYNIDDLAPFVQDNGKLAESQIGHARKLIEKEVEDSYARIKAYDANDTLKDLRKVAEEIREKELSRALHKLGKVTDKEKAIVDLLTRRIVNKLLYEPTARLKEHVGRGDGETYDEAIRELFGIDQEN
jgi:glutamyl-tRNA reductase